MKTITPPPTIEKLKLMSLSLVDESSIVETVDLEPEDLQALISGYFEVCVQSNKPPTMTGLAMTLGLTRQQLKYFNHNDQRIQIMLEKSKQIVIEYVEQLLLSGRPAAGFSLWLRNNDDWVDKTETVSTQRKASDVLDAIERNAKQGKLIE